jgi:hypothetical protein
MRWESEANCSGRIFKGHVPVQLGIGGTVDLTHSAFTDLLNYFVMADACPDHSSPFPFCGKERT